MQTTDFSWLDRSEYPFQPHYFELGAGNRLHYLDEGKGKTILFVHGTPSWSFDFRNVIKLLLPHYRCIAPDHIGFGLSDKPRHYDYSTQQHARTLEQFMLEKDLRDISLVVHDFGGPIGLSAALRQSDRISNIVVLNSWFWSSEEDAEFKRLRTILKSPLLPFLYKYLNFSPRFILPQSFGDHKLPARLLSQYTRPFANASQRLGALAFARSLLNDQQWFEEGWNRREPIKDKKLLLVWGMKDKTITPKYLRKFQAGFSHTETVELPNCGHFPQEEAPDVVAKAIKAFVG